MSTLFTPEEIVAGRRRFHIFMSFNVLAFSILTGNVISVFALELGVNNTYIGLLQSFMHLSMVFLIVGRVMMQRVSYVRVFAVGWLIRYVFASLLLLIPLVLGRDDVARIAGVIILVAMGGFHVFRGIGVAGQVPIVGGLASGSDRGRFLSVNSVLANGIALIGGLVIALLLGRDAPLQRFIYFFGFAILSGYVSVFQVWKLPEPRRSAESTFGSFLSDIRSVASDVRLRRFLTYLVFVALSMSVSAAFLVVISKRVFGLPDNFTVLLVAIGNFGAVVSGLLNRRLIDRLGPKPLVVFYQLTALAVTLFIVAAVTRVTGSGLAIMVVAFFFSAAAQSGLFVAGQAYYFSLYAEQKHANLGLLYSLVNGVVGTVASYSGGVLLDAFEARFALPDAIRRLFLILAAVTTVALVLAWSLPLEGQRQSRLRRRLRALLIALRGGGSRGGGSRGE